MLLVVHPSETQGVVRSLTADATRSATHLRLRWQLDGELGAIRIPDTVAPARADLWRHTCFEAFIAADAQPGYCELNFSPSGAWAAYRFSSYRTGMSPLPLGADPECRWRREPECLVLEAAVSLASLLPGAGHGGLRLALAAVVEARSGALSHWALGHPEAKPDFHQRAAFMLALPARGVAGEGGADEVRH